MRDPERAMLSYVQLAGVARRRHQTIGADKFLVLAGAEACRAGWLEVAERCRSLVLADNPQHLLGRYPRFADAMRSPDFQAFLVRLERFVGSELAEHLVQELGAAVPESGEGVGSWCLEQLEGPVWEPD